MKPERSGRSVSATSSRRICRDCLRKQTSARRWIRSRAIRVFSSRRLWHFARRRELCRRRGDRSEKEKISANRFFWNCEIRKDTGADRTALASAARPDRHTEICSSGASAPEPGCLGLYAGRGGHGEDVHPGYRKIKTRVSGGVSV